MLSRSLTTQVFTHGGSTILSIFFSLVNLGNWKNLKSHALLSLKKLITRRVVIPKAWRYGFWARASLLVYIIVILAVRVRYSVISFIICLWTCNIFLMKFFFTVIFLWILVCTISLEITITHIKQSHLNSLLSQPISSTEQRIK